MSKKDLPLLLDQVASSSQIQALLREYKDLNRDKIKLTGNKSQLIENLIDTMNENIIPFSKVFKLVQEAEEHGNQYVYLFKANKDKINVFNDGVSIRNKIIPKNVYTSFPRITLIPDELQWADFRTPNKGVTNTWVSKLYDKVEKNVKINENYDASSRKTTITYKRKSSRVVYLIYWDGKGSLEYRMSRTTFDTVKGLDESLKKINSKIFSAIDIKVDFLLYDLAPTINNLITQAESNGDLYSVMSVNLVDSQDGVALIKTYGHQKEDIFSETSRKNAIEAYLNNNGRGKGVVIRFLASGSNSEITRDINVILGRDEINQLIIPSKIIAKEYNYVRRKIEQFS